MPRPLLNDKELEEVFIEKCYRFITIRNRSEKEVRDYLHKKNCPSHLVERLITRLKNEDLVDDKKFISWWVEQRSYFKPKGSFILKQELLRKGVAKDLIDQYLQENQLDELTLAKTALPKKIKSWQGLNQEEKHKKAINFLLRRGFSYEVAKKALEIVFNNNVE